MADRDASYPPPVSGIKPPTFMDAARKHRSECGCHHTGHVEWMFDRMLGDDEKKARQKHWGSFLVHCMSDSDDEGDDESESGGRSISSKAARDATAKGDSRDEVQSAQGTTTGTGPNAGMDVDMHMAVDEFILGNSIEEFGSVLYPYSDVGLNPVLDYLDTRSNFTLFNQEQDGPESGEASFPSWNVDPSTPVEEEGQTSATPASAPASTPKQPAPKQRNRQAPAKGGTTSLEGAIVRDKREPKAVKTTKLRAATGQKAGKYDKKAAARKALEVKFKSSPTTNKKTSGNVGGRASTSTVSKATRSSAVVSAAGPSSDVRRSTRTRVTIDIEKWTTPLTERAPAGEATDAVLGTVDAAVTGGNQQGNVDVTLTVNADQLHVAATIAATGASGAPASTVHTEVTVGATPNPAPAPPVVATGTNSILHYQPQQHLFMPYYPAAPVPGVIALPYAPVYPSFGFTPLYPPPYFPALPAPLPLANGQPGLAQSVDLSSLQATPIAPSQALAVSGGGHVSSQPAPQSVPVQATQPSKVPKREEEPELIWCGHIGPQQLDENLGCRMNYRCKHLIRKTKEAIESHYVLAHGTNSSGSREKCSWGSECKHCGRGGNLGNHILDKHLNGEKRLCEGKGCKLGRVTGTRWCAAATCQRIAPVWENREPYQQHV